MKKTFTLLLVLSSLNLYASVYYVKPSGSDANTGTTSWDNALRTVQKALSKAVYGDQVWVAAGNYYPDEMDASNSNDRTASFVLKPGVALYGGFAGNETLLSQRNWQTNVSKLTGDLLQNDGANFTNIDDNAYNVVKSASLNSTTILDGFTITAGNNNGGFQDAGGMLNNASSPLITHCTFSYNNLHGIFNINSSPAISYCSFVNNNASGIANVSQPGTPVTSTAPTIDNCSFSGHTNGGLGYAALTNIISSPKITACTFSGNFGAMGNFSSSSVVKECSFTNNAMAIVNGRISSSDATSYIEIKACTFTGNTQATIGNMEGSTAQVTGSTFSGNNATSDNSAPGVGAAIYNYTGFITLNQCSFIGNTAANAGGAIANLMNGDATIVNCRFYQNSAPYGGAILNGFLSFVTADNSTMKIFNCSFYDNTATSGAAGAILNGGLANANSTLQITNSILWGNTFSQTVSQPGSSTSISYSLVQDGTTDNHNSTGDPLFVDAAGGDLHLKYGSPAIDAGSNSALPQGFSSDLDGNTRIFNSVVDMGAYEFQPASSTGGIIYVDSSAHGSNNGTSWQDAYNYLQDGLAKAATVSSSVSIWVAKGTYYPDQGTGITDNSTSVSFRLRNNVGIYGGFAGTETQLKQRNWVSYPTILSGEIQKDQDNTNNSAHVVTSESVNNTAVLDGFTITGGYNQGSYGGGIFNSFSSPTISNCRFYRNTAGRGAGIENWVSDAIIVNCSFIQNTAGDKGGAIDNEYCSPSIVNCLFLSNHGENTAGAISVNSNASPLITNCTFFNNSTHNSGGAVGVNMSNATIINSILWADIPDEISNSSSSISISYSLVQGGNTANHNLNSDPLFAATGDYHLQACSPAVNAGNTQQVPQMVTTDLDGNPRIYPLNIGGVDLGCYETQALACCPSGNVFYVNKNATGNNNGTSWTNAFTSLQDALAQTIVCPNVSQIWVAKATYYPDQGKNVTDNDRNASFVIPAGVMVYGGFVGTETNLSQRNWQTNLTTLSGDLLQDDGANFTNITDNSYHVASSASLDSLAGIDGFTITAGNSSCDNYYTIMSCMGAGMLNEASSPAIRNCTFTANAGAELFGAALVNYNSSSPIITGCTFSNNQRGGIMNGLGAYMPGFQLPPGTPNNPCFPIITNCSFTISGNNWGIINSMGSHDTIRNCSFSGSNTGGGIVNASCSPTISNCTFTLLAAGILNDKAAAADPASSPLISNCIFSSLTGSGIINGSASPTISDCTFTGNTVPAGNSYIIGGAAIFNGPSTNSIDVGSTATIINCKFINNNGNVGGAILNSSSSATVINSLFWGNSASIGGAIVNGSIFTTDPSSLTLINCTISGNTASQTAGAILNGGSTLTIKNSIVWGNSSPDAEIIYPNTAPLITYSIIAGGYTGTGNKSSNPLFTEATNGDLHLQPTSPAIDAANNGDVPQGISTDLDGQSRIINSTVDMGVYEHVVCGSGGIIYVNRNAYGNNDGSSWLNAFTSLKDALTRTANCSNVTQVWVAKGTYLPDESGADRSASFVLKNNLALYGGFAGTESSLSQRKMKENETILSGEIQKNTNNADNSYHVLTATSVDTTAVLDGFTITSGNANGLSEYNGGAIFLNSASPKIVNCKFNQNKAYNGGALFNTTSSPVIINCSFYQNNASLGAAIYYSGNYTENIIVNSTFSANAASIENGGAINNPSSKLSIYNSIIWGNTGGQLVNGSTYTAVVSYSLVQNGSTDNNNLNVDPVFLNPGIGDLHLQGCSPAINKGSDVVNKTTVDLDGNTRKVGTIDMGAFEFQANQVGIVYVDSSASGNNDGTSWGNAFNSLQDALNKTGSCLGQQVQVWVAKGTYYPDKGTGKIKDSRFESFFLKNGVAILGGFAGTENVSSQRNSLLNETILSGEIQHNGDDNDNSYHVVQAVGVDQTAQLFDVSITGGNPGVNPEWAIDGGGLYIGAANPGIYNCTFKDNAATYGGGVYITSSTSVTLYRCSFINNTAIDGGAVYNLSSQAQILDCKFLNNSATSQGGGVHNYSSSLNITNSLFWNNSANQGGGIFNYSGYVTVVNSTLLKNIAIGINGGAIYNNASVNITNSILWANTPDQAAGYTTSITYSLVQGASLDTLNHILNVDPQFKDMATGDLHLQPCSPAIDEGDNEANPTSVDLDNNSRIENKVIDLGAYEAQDKLCCPSGNVLYVKQTATGKNTGTSWTDAFTSLQEAIQHTNICANVTQIWVAAGTYTPDTYDRTASFTLQNNLAIYGGFPATGEPVFADRDPDSFVSTLSGEIDKTYGAYSYHIVIGNSVDNTAVLDGVTIKGGNANGPYQQYQEHGAGLYLKSSSPTINDCKFVENNADRYGAAIFDSASSPVISKCSFINNTAIQYHGGAIYNDYLSSPVISNCSFINNDAGGHGGAIYNGGGSAPLITNSRFNGNRADSYGGAIANWGTSPTVRNSIFTGNVANWGGAIFNETAAPSIYNCSFYGDTANLGGAIYNIVYSSPKITNSIFWGNSSEITNSPNSSPVVTYSIVKGGVYTGTGNKNQDPLFTGASAGNLHLETGSPAIDAGVNSVVQAGDLDLDGKTRIIKGTVDMGAYEFGSAVLPLEIICPENFNVNTDAGTCAAVVTFTGSHAASASGGTGTITINYSPASGSVLAAGNTTVTATATDAEGNTTSCTFVVTVTDNEPPVVVTQNISVGLNGSGTANITAEEVNNNSTDNCGILNMVLSTTSFTTANIGANTVTLTVTDIHGNQASQTAIVTVGDNIGPVVVTRNISVYLSASGTVTITASQVDNGSTDDSGIQEMTLSNISFNCNNVGSNTVTLTVTDIHGNQSSGTATVTVVDNLAPIVITKPATIYLDAAGVATLTTADVDNNSSDNCGIGQMTLSKSSFDCSNIGANTVTLTATDNSLNASSGTAVITVIDNQLPIIVAPANLSVNTDAGKCYATVDIGTATATDNCTYLVSNTAPANHQFEVGATTVTWTVVDAGNHTLTATQVITVADQEKPTISAPADLKNVPMDAHSCFAYVNLGSPVTSDNCGVYTVTTDAPGTFAFGNTTVTWTVTDVHGNTATDTQVITVVDTQPPTIVAPANLSVSTDAGKCYATVDIGTATATDNCTYLVSNTTPANHQFEVGATTVTWTVVDAGNHTVTATQVITVADNENPWITAALDVSHAADPGKCTAAKANVNLFTPKSGDNCGVSTVVNDAPAEYPLGNTTVTWTVTDVHGNTATDTQLVTITDTEFPVISRTSNISVNNDLNTCGAVVAYTVTATDNCGIASFSSVPASGTLFPVGTTTVTITATDASGNTATRTFNITVTDIQPPTFTRPKNITVFTTATCTYDITPAKTGDVTNEADNCGGSLQATYTDVEETGTCLGMTLIHRTWHLKDLAGNSADDQEQLITIKDNTPPTFTAPKSITIYTANDCSYDATPAKTGDVTNESDNCTTGLQATYTDVVKDGSCAGSKIITRTWHLIDNCYNAAADQVQIITVSDKAAPTFTKPKDTTIYMSINCTYDPSPTVTGNPTNLNDNCDKALKSTYTDFVTSGTCSGTVVINRTWRLKDACGNIATPQVQVISVLDSTRPTFTRPADVTINKDVNCTYNADPTITGDVVNEADNCSKGLQATYTDQTLAGTCAGETVIRRTWQLKDNCSNKAADQVQTITIKDISPPNAVCKNISIYLGTSGTVTITAADVDDGSSDACGGTLSRSIDKNTFTTSNIGNNNVVLSVTDLCGNTSTCTAVVNVAKRPTVITYTSDVLHQYSDPQVLSATLVDALTNTPLQSKPIQFTIGAQSVSATTTAGGQTTTYLIITQDPAGTYTVTTYFAGDAIYEASTDLDAFDVLQEDARVTYTGSLFSSTAGVSSGKAMVTLAATIQDISTTLDAAGDVYPGDVRKAQVKFINVDNGQDISGWLTPGLINPSDTTIGTVTFNWSLDIGAANSQSYTVGIVVSAYYFRSCPADETVVTISKPLPDFVTGGGYLLLETPSGFKAGDIGTKNNFGFNVKYNNPTRNLIGSINTIVRRTEPDGIHVYQIKGNAMTSLTIDAILTSMHPYPIAVFDGKANIQDVTNPLNVISIDGNASLHVEMTDKGEPGIPQQPALSDMIAITVWNKSGGLWFASNWSVNKTVQQPIAAGNIRITSGTQPGTLQASLTTLTSSNNPSSFGNSVTFKAVVTPLSSSNSTPTGKITFYDGNSSLKVVSLSSVNGVMTASFIISKLTVGTHTITAVYSGDKNFATSVSTLIQEVYMNLNVKNRTEQNDFEVTAYPNPSAGDFNLVIRSTMDQVVNIRIVDAWGRVIEQRTNIIPNSIVKVGTSYQPGTYFAELRQERKTFTVKLIKQPQ